MPTRSHRRAARFAIFAFAVFAWICSGSAPAIAQQSNRDYYATSPDNELLRAINRYHTDPASEKLRAQRYDAALGDIAFVLRYFPNHPQALMLMIDVCGQWKSPRCDPKEPLEDAIAVNPNVAATYTLQGIYLYRAKRYLDAIASFQKAVALDPNSFNAHYNLGLAYFETGQYDLANEHAQRAYQLGASLPGLRDKLNRAGQWKSIDPPAPSTTTPVVPQPTPSPVPR